MFCVRKGCSFNKYVPRDGLKNFDREFYRLKIRRAPSGRPRLIQKKLRCWWTKILILLLETLLMISRSHIKVFFTIFAKLMKSTDSMLAWVLHAPRPPDRGPTDALDRDLQFVELMREESSFLNSFVTGNNKLIVYKYLERKRS